MGALISQVLSALGGEAFTKLKEWWASEGKLLFVGWWQKRQGRKEQHEADRSAQLAREADEVSRANQRVEVLSQAAEKRRADGTPPLFKARKR